MVDPDFTQLGRLLDFGGQPRFLMPGPFLPREVAEAWRKSRGLLGPGPPYAETLHTAPGPLLGCMVCPGPGPGPCPADTSIVGSGDRTRKKAGFNEKLIEIGILQMGYEQIYLK